MILMITSFTAMERAAKNTSRFQLQLYLIRTHATLLVSSHVAFFTSANDDSFLYAVVNQRCSSNALFCAILSVGRMQTQTV